MSVRKQIHKSPKHHDGAKTAEILCSSRTVLSGNFFLVLAQTCKSSFWQKGTLWLKSDQDTWVAASPGRGKGP